MPLSIGIATQPASLLAARRFLHSITELHIGVLTLHLAVNLHYLLIPRAGTLGDAALLVCCLAGLAMSLVRCLTSLVGCLACMLCHLF
jgi:hypothetical protein